MTPWIVSAILLIAGPAYGQAFPTKPVRIIASGQPGGGVDFNARVIAPDLSRLLGQPVVVENRPGEVVATETVVRAPPDGYTLLMSGSGMLFLPLLRENVPYDPVKSFAPITMVHQSPTVLVVYPPVAAKTAADLIALAKVRPSDLDYASSGTGTSTHLAAQLFRAMAGINVVHIPYKSSAAALTALMGGHVKFMFGTPASVASHVTNGRLRALAITSAQPSALFPGLPTVAASGLPGYEAVATNGVLAPAGTPAAIVGRLNREIVRVLQQPDIKEKFFNAGSEVIGSSPEQYALAISSELAKWGKVIKAAGIKAD